MFMKQKNFIFFSVLLFILLLTSACFPDAPTSQPTKPPATQTQPTEEAANETETSPTASPLPTEGLPQELLPPVSYGPNQEDFPAGINPLTGLPAADPHLLKQPALLLSITHFPPQARPQAGLSFSPWVFEYLISSGSTRFAAIMYGQTPYPEAPQTGDCEVRMEPFVQESDILLGNRVWLDQNADGIQSPGEPGVGGICVVLFRNGDYEHFWETSTDSNGYYAFNLPSDAYADPQNASYEIYFDVSGKFKFTTPDIGYDNYDSDADPMTGKTPAFQPQSTDLTWDAGLLPLSEESPAEDIPPAEVGPIRSGRLIHIHLQNAFQDSCLIHDGASEEIVDKLPTCASVFNGYSGVGSMLDISRMEQISEKNARTEGSDFNYANNLFSEIVPTGGVPALEVDMFFAQLNQSKWVYDPSYQGWLRYVDNTSEPVEFHVDTDRLTGRQIFFENVVVLFVEHEVIHPLIIDQYLGQGEQGFGFLFRDGQKFKIKWNTLSGDYEKQTGKRRPIALTDEAGNPIALRPGKTWVVVATPFSDYFLQAKDVWKIRIYPPEGTGVY